MRARIPRMSGAWKTVRGLAVGAAAAGGAYLAGSYAAARSLEGALTSPRGLTPGIDDRSGFLEALSRRAAIVEEFEHPGDPLDPVTMIATFASPGDPGSRGTVVFLHGKGGNATEWLPDALRALDAGSNALIPDLRGHGRSGGEFITFGLLERGDVRRALDETKKRFGADVRRVGLHACSYGGAPALQLAGGDASIRALWLESPFGDVLGMARHYLSLKSGLPAWTLGLTTRWALARADARIRRALSLPRGQGLEAMDPIAAAGRVRCPVELVYGARDELAMPEFLGSLVDALPRTTVVWKVDSAGHCHHADGPLETEKAEYEKRWRQFFGRLEA